MVGYEESTQDNGGDEPFTASDPSREAFIKEWAKKIKDGAVRHEPAFKRMREDMDLARTGCDKSWAGMDAYAVPIIRRHIKQSVDRTFARLPKAYAQLRKRLEYRIWDGQQASLEQAMQHVGEAGILGLPVDPTQVALLEEVEEVKHNKLMLQRAGDTLAILFNYFIEEPRPSFKQQMKGLLRRARVCGVGYVQLGFQRQLSGMTNDMSARIDDASKQIERMEAMRAELLEDNVDEQDAKVEELRQSIATIQQQSEAILREGLVFDFPRSTEVIVDPECTNLEGFIGAGWVARERFMTARKIRQIYKVDIKDAGVGYAATRNGAQEEKGAKDPKFCLRRVWDVQNIDDRQIFTICEGYCDYLRPPGPPDVEVEGFWTLFPLVINPVEHEDELFPPSDVRDLKHAQEEYNRAREGLREHRKANRPAYGVRKGLLDDEDKDKLANRPAHAVVELNAMNEQDDVRKVLQRIEPVPIDPNLYDTTAQLEDVFRGAGTQEAVIGGASGATATEVAVGENAMSSGASSDVDTIDEYLVEIARASGQIMLSNMSPEQVQEIVGPGFVWPNLSREQMVKEVTLTVKAGSTGRPNKAAELANRERAMPWLVQLPGINPTPITRDYLELLDIDPEDAIAEGAPSITAMNAMATAAATQPSTGDPENDPAAQGDEGGDNAEKPREEEPGAQPAFPQPGTGIAGR